MIDINQIFAGMVSAIQSSDFPDWSKIASILGLDLSEATITATDGGAVAIVGARLPAQPAVEVGVAGLSKPRKTLDFVFFNSGIPLAPYVEAVLGSDQRVEPSTHGKGLTIAFRMGDFNCGITASAPDGVVETLFCAA
jgi:hypothetical protein